MTDTPTPSELLALHTAVAELTEEARKIRRHSVDARVVETSHAWKVAAAFVVVIVMPWMVWLSNLLLTTRDATQLSIANLRVEVLRHAEESGRTYRSEMTDAIESALGAHRRELHELQGGTRR